MIILEASFPFVDKPEHKKRPVLALTEPIGIHKTIVCAFISSKIPENLLDSDFILKQDHPCFIESGLIYSSVIRLHKLASLETETSITGIIGSLESNLAIEIKTKLKKMFNL
jgi:mRNA interferase MazF